MARRRMGQELKDFTSAFLSGYKIFADADRRGGKSSDPYSDDNLAKNDSRLGGGSFLGKLFGGGEEALTGADRGRAAIDAQMRIAIERGDYKKLEELMQGSKKFELLTKNPLVGEKPGKEPEAAVPVPGRRADADPENKDKKVVALKQEDPEKDDTATEAFDPNQTNNRLVADLGFEPDADSPLRYGADWTDVGSKISSIFTAGGGMVPNMSRGGAVPTQYAALGASVIDPKGDTGGLVGERGTPRSAIPLQQDDEAVDYYEGDPNDIRDPEEEEGTPVRPMGPAVNPEQAPNVARGKSLDLPRDPQELAGVAAQAVKAGLDRINEEFKGEGALGTPSPNRAALVKSFANSEGRFSDEEVAQIDKIIDPDNKLPPDMKSAARIAAIYKFYEGDGDPETARNAAARMLLYNKNLSQRLGAEALDAFQKGDMQKGIERLTTAYNETLPDGQQIRASVNDDGSVTYSVGHERDGEWVETGGGRTDKNGLIQLASNTARSDAYMTRLYAITESLKAAKGGGKGAAPAGGVSTSDFMEGIQNVRTAAEAVKAARADGDPEKIAQAEADLRAREAVVSNMPVGKTKQGKVDTVEVKRRQDLVNGIIRSILTPAAANGTPRAGAGTATEREEARTEVEARRLGQERALVEAGDLASRGLDPEGKPTRIGGMSEAAAAEIARRKFGTKVPDYYAADAGVGDAAETARNRVNQKRAALGYKGAKDSSDADDTVANRAKLYMEALEGTPNEKTGKRTGGILNEVPIDKNGDRDPNAARPALTSAQRDAYTDIFGRLAAKNTTLSERTLAGVVYDITNPSKDEVGGRAKRLDVDYNTGRVTFNGKTFYADDQSLLEMAQMRGKALRSMQADEKAAAGRRRTALEKEEAAAEERRNAGTRLGPIPEPLRGRAEETAANLEAQIARMQQGVSNPNMPSRTRDGMEAQIKQMQNSLEVLRNRIKPSAVPVR
jgi:hypothetical protein